MQFYKALFIVMWQKKPFWCGGENATHFKNIFVANSSLRSHLSVKSFDFRCILQFTSAIPLKIGDIFQRSLQFSKSVWLVWDESKILHFWCEMKIDFKTLYFYSENIKVVWLQNLRIYNSTMGG